MAIGSISDIYSGETSGAWSSLSGVEKNRYEAYKSKRKRTMDDLLGQIVNREAFDYDLANDKLYDQYKEAYAALGQDAMTNTVANAEGLSGGYGNTYAEPAASEGYQEYLREMNDIIPELYEIAMNKHAMETDELRNRFAAVADAEDREYGQHRDTVKDWTTDRGYYFDKYKTNLQNDMYMADLAQKDEQFNREMQYNYDRDAWEKRKKAEAEAAAAAEKAMKESQKTAKGSSGKRKTSGGRSGSFSSEFIAPDFEPNSKYSAVLHNALEKGDMKEAKSYLDELVANGDITETEYKNLYGYKKNRRWNEGDLYAYLRGR